VRCLLMSPSLSRLGIELFKIPGRFVDPDRLCSYARCLMNIMNHVPFPFEFDECELFSPCFVRR
jgi:hypothetical protein